MPGVTPNPDAWLKAQLNSMQAQITALATSQQAYVLDHNSVQRVLMGWQQAFNTYGIAISDSSGNPRVMIGELPDGNHGIAIYDQDNDGGYVELNAPVGNQASGTLSTTSTSFTTLGGSPTVSISVGSSGKALIGISAILGNTAGDGCVMELFVDGVGGIGPVISLQSTTAIQTTATGVAIATGMTQGAHTLSLEYKSASGSTANFSNPSMFAIPY